jgi:apolipoprotein D and lipocalin family protein
MFNRLVLAAVAALAFVAPASAGPRLELNSMMGRWYEVARTPNMIQNGCVAGASEWTPAAKGFAVIQTCRKGSPEGQLKTWKAKATVADPANNAKFKMAFFGGVVSQEYTVVEHRPDQGWLVMVADGGKYVWLFSQKPTLPAAVRAQAVARIRQLGFDTARLEFPQPSRS